MSPWVVGCPHPGLADSAPVDFVLHTDALGQRDFQTVMQEKTLALAQALQACTEDLGVPTGILCESAWELQKCIASLMTLSGDDIVETSLLKPTGEEHGTSPIPEEEATLLGEEIELPQVSGSLPEWLEIPSFVEPGKWSTTPSAPSPSPMPQPGCHPS